MSAPRARGARFGAALGLLLAAACRDVIVGETEDVATELCGVLRACEPVPPACDDIDARFRAARTADVDAFLLHHASADCLGSCRDARVCRDLPPLCDFAGAPCTSGAACCGSTVGEAACGDGACCHPVGAPCSQGTCCGDVVCSTSGVCGAIACARIGETCEENAQCCSRRCTGGACTAKTCGDLGDPCLEDADCCEEGVVCQGVCVPAPEQCLACVPVAGHASNCCEASGQVCYVNADDTTQCGSAGCLPVGVACGSDEDCCEGTTCKTGAFLPYCF